MVLSGCKKEPPPAPAQPAVTDVQTFCVATLRKVMDCFHDDNFWDIFATTYLAKYPDSSGNPDAKKQWIGMRKDDMVNLRKGKAFEQNCQAMIEHNKVPTAEDMKPVQAAMGKSCGEFGGTFGFLLFHRGAFHDPR
jgi:hypothetical protein